MGTSRVTGRGHRRGGLRPSHDGKDLAAVVGKALRMVVATGRGDPSYGLREVENCK